MNTPAPANPMPVFAGIIKIGHQDVLIQDDTQVTCDELTKANNLTRLPKEKLHCTLGHQSIGGLKAAIKAQKKALKKGDKDPIILPATQLPNIDTIDSTVMVVEDNDRKTVRIVLKQELQDALSSWVAELCSLNNFIRDEVEMQRIYHISFANKTGSPGDSVR